MADSATSYFGAFETNSGTRHVGVPLLVHRRCEEPMFTISNRIAYENLMVNAKSPKQSFIRDVLGNSKWIHVEGNCQDKWCQLEGDILISLLHQIRDNNCTPDFYIITPFVVVQNQMREHLKKNKILDNWIKNSNVYDWLTEHVGTVHTVQGREAEAVFFILGAPLPEHKGARIWAGKTPNLLNVATTRAKEVLYVIGNRYLWKNSGVFKTLDEILP